jgi:hypothetical protein
LIITCTSSGIAASLALSLPSSSAKLEGLGSGIVDTDTEGDSTGIVGFVPDL